MKMFLLLLFLAGDPSGTVLKSVVPTAEQQVVNMRVRERRVACDGLNGRTECYQVQKGAAVGSEEWETLPGEIENFRHEEGYQYDISVEVTMNPNVADEKSRYSYKLIEVLSKTKI